MSAPKQPQEKSKQCFYLVDETQTTRIEMFRLSLRALADLGGSAGRDEPLSSTVEIGRIELANLIDFLDYGLGAILSNFTEKSVWIDEDGKTVSVTM